jgi:DNA-binding transcriptional LysR family regulator
MEIWQLNTFKVVAKTLHFTQASQELNLTQSAVSHQIKSLEQELGVRLFLRDKRKISLTSQGNRVLDYANKMFRQIEVMRNEIEDNKETLEGLVRIVAVTRSLNCPFSEFQRDFQSIYPEIDLKFDSVYEYSAIFENLRKGISDIGLTVRNEDSGDLLSIPYGQFELLFVVGRNHRLAKRKTVNIKDLENEKWILFEEGGWLRAKTDEIFKDNNFNPKNISDSNDGNIVCSLIKEGEGVGFMPSWGIWEALEEEKLIHVKIKDVIFKAPLNIVVSPNNRSKLISVFINYLLEKKVSGIDPYKKSKTLF